MARVRDLWFKTVGVDANGKPVKAPTARHGKGKRWLACWTGQDGKEATKAFEGKARAATYGTQMEADRLRGTYVDPKQGQQRLQEYGEEKWLPSQLHLRPNSVELYEQHLRKHIYPRLG